MRANVVVVASFFYLLMAAFYFFISGIEAIYLIDELLLVYVFCVLPVVVCKDFSFEYQRKSEVSIVFYVAVLSAPILLLLTDRLLSGFTLEFNPVLMRDQMLQRHRDGGGSVFSVLGNLCTIPAYILIIDNALFGKGSRFRVVLSVVFLAFMVWIAGSRAFILVIMGTAWMLAGFPMPKGRYYALIALVFVMLSSVFLLRASRSDISIEWYVVNVLDHLGVSYDFNLVQTLGVISGVFVISFAYVFHSLEVVSKTIDMYETSGISIGPISHMLNKLFGVYNDGFQFPGLFMSEFGNVLYDLGWVGVVLFFSLKTFLIFYLSRLRSVFWAGIVLFLVLNCVFGILSPLYNLLFFYPVIFSCLVVFLWRSQWIKLRYL